MGVVEGGLCGHEWAVQQLRQARGCRGGYRRGVVQRSTQGEAGTGGGGGKWVGAAKQVPGVKLRNRGELQNSGGGGKLQFAAD